MDRRRMLAITAAGLGGMAFGRTAVGCHRKRCCNPCATSNSGLHVRSKRPKIDPEIIARLRSNTSDEKSDWLEMYGWISCQNRLVTVSGLSGGSSALRLQDGEDYNDHGALFQILRDPFGNLAHANFQNA